ncbi:oxygenase MpaB family protein [Mycobacteroides salmoniphilum]|uniref:oxygenase MpaB family protein n=1 Tax=Mycobacteroides salmoniphilum TaxID=404941 RepID=UPI0009918EB1|nr:oxygenase MpaB family protein [Mycobacteroides salmoniphilum]
MKHSPARLVDLVNPASLLLPASNVIMQLSHPGVGYGVLESPVDSGNVYKHPFKRARTTGMFLAVATMGSRRDREVMKRGVDAVHRQVRSTPKSPVTYNAFDPGLQLWVAACLYQYYVQAYESLHGPLDDATADQIYRDGARIGTALQVRPEEWPPDRDAFNDYWKRSLDELRIDAPVREHLLGVASFKMLPWPLRMAGRFNLFATKGFLPPQFRELLQVPWTDGDQRRFDALLSALRIADRMVPAQLWTLSYAVLIWDMRLRERMGKPVV